MKLTQSGRKIQIHLSDAETLELISKLTSHLAQRQKHSTTIAYHEVEAVFVKNGTDNAAAAQFFVGKI